jgi:hypothetical protein
MGDSGSLLLLTGYQHPVETIESNKGQVLGIGSAYQRIGVRRGE